MSTHDPDDPTGALSALLARAGTGEDPVSLQAEADAAGVGWRFGMATSGQARRPPTFNDSIRDRLRFAQSRHDFALALIRPTEKETTR